MNRLSSKTLTRALLLASVGLLSTGALHVQAQNATAPVAVNQPLAPTVWNYKASGQTDAQATGKTARDIAPGDSGDAQSFNWNLYDLPRGRFKITARIKPMAAPTGGDFRIVSEINMPGRESESLDLLKTNADQLKAGEFQTLSGEFSNNFDARNIFFFSRIGNNLGVPVRLDNVQIELLERAPETPAPAALQTWSFEPVGIMDTLAAGGQAGESHPENLRWTFDAPLGEYEATIRVRIKDAAKWDMAGNKESAFSLAMKGRGADDGDGDGFNVGSGLEANRALRPSSLRSDRYTDIRFPFSVLLPSAAVGPRFSGDQNVFGDVLVDSVKVRLLKRLTETEAAQRAGVAIPANALKPQAGTQVWMARGLFAIETGVPAALAKMDAKVSESWFVNFHERYTHKGEIPSDDALLGMDVVVIQDLPGRLISLKRRAALNNFVKQGGGLLVIGGMYGLDRGGYGQSDLLSEIFPATVSQTPTLHELMGAPALKLGANPQVLRGFAPEANSRVDYIHTITPKAGANVELQAGTAPVLVTGTIGKGRVAILAAPPLGTPKEGALFTDSPKWSGAMQNVLAWLAKSPN